MECDILDPLWDQNVRFVENFIQDRIAEWVTEVENLSIIAESQPQAAYAIFIHCLVSRWNYPKHTVLNISGLLQPLEGAIRYRFLPALTGRLSFSDNEGDLFALPT